MTGTVCTCIVLCHKWSQIKFSLSQKQTCQLECGLWLNFRRRIYEYSLKLKIIELLPVLFSWISSCTDKTCSKTFRFAYGVKYWSTLSYSIQMKSTKLANMLNNLCSRQLNKPRRSTDCCNTLKPTNKLSFTAVCEKLNFVLENWKW